MPFHWKSTGNLLKVLKFVAKTCFYRRRKSTRVGIIIDAILQTFSLERACIRRQLVFFRKQFLQNRIFLLNLQFRNISGLIMPNSQKRKRKRVSESERTPAKKSRRSATHTPKTPKSDKKPGKNIQFTYAACSKIIHFPANKHEKDEKSNQKKKRISKMLNSKKKKRLSAQRHRTRRTRDIRQKVARTVRIYNNYQYYSLLIDFYSSLREHSSKLQKFH